MPFEFAVTIAKNNPRKIKYLPPYRKIIINDYLEDITVEVDTTFPIEKMLITGSYDPFVQSIISHHVKDGFVCIDVGANIGAVSLALAKKIGPSGKLFCVEPGNENFRKLCNNFKLNPELDKITCCEQLGLADKEGLLNWSEDPNNLGNATLLSPHGVPVPVFTLDIFCLSHSIQKLNFIKIDVEGMEYEVLLGGKKAIKEFRPLIFMEANAHFETVRDKPLSKMIYELLSDWNYKFIDPLTLKIFSSIPKDRNDVLACPAELQLELSHSTKEPM